MGVRTGWLGWLVGLGLLPLATQGVTLADFEARTQGKTPYRLFKPKNYDAKKSYPLNFFLHGGGERGKDNSLQVTGQTAGPFSLAREEVQAEFPCFVAVPQMDVFPAGWTDATVRQDILAIIETLAKEFSIDKKRVHVTGNSMGGAGTVFLLQNDPTVFATGAPVCPWFEGGNPNTITNAMNKPWWFFHGAADGTAAPKNSKDLVDLLRKGGKHVHHSVYPGVNHDSWNKAYADPDYPRWVLTKSLDWKWPIEDGKTYRMQSVASKKYLGTDATPAATPTLVQVMEAASDKSQQWTLDDQGNGYYKILQVSSGKALQVSGTNLTLAALAADDSQLWLMWEIGDRFKIVSKASHLADQNQAITFAGDGMAEGAKASMAAYEGTDKQRFVLQAVADVVTLRQDPTHKRNPIRFSIPAALSPADMLGRQGRIPGNAKDH
jgi:dienelactone hydrolase